MSDTPETDANCYETEWMGAQVIHSDYARKLERERDEARKIVEDWREEMFFCGYHGDDYREIPWENT